MKNKYHFFFFLVIFEFHLIRMSGGQFSCSVLKFYAKNRNRRNLSLWEWDFHRKWVIKSSQREARLSRVLAFPQETLTHILAATNSGETPSQSPTFTARNTGRDVVFLHRNTCFLCSIPRRSQSVSRDA